MTIADKIRSLITIKNQIKTVIAAKGIAINDATPYSEYPVKIQSIIGLDPSKGAVEFFSDANLIYISKLTLPPISVIQSRAFISVNIRQVVLSEGLKTIGDYAFQGNAILDNISFPSSLITIGSYAFKSCTMLQKVELLGEIYTIGTEAFRFCIELLEVVIDCKVTRIENNCFYGCSKLQTVTLSNLVTQLTYGAFSGATALTSINLEHIIHMENNCFFNCSSLKNVVLTNLTTTGTSLFTNASSLESIVIGTKLLTLPSSMVTYAPKLKSIIFPDQITSFSQTALQSCTGLKYMEFKRTSNFSIAGGAFNTLTSLEAVVLRTTTPPTISGSSAPFLAIPTTAKIYVPDSSVDSYKTASGWSLLSAYIRPMSEFVMPIL